MKKKKDWGIYDKKICKAIAKHLKKYIEAIDRYYIIDGSTVKGIKKAKKKIKKACKHLKNGKPHKVFKSEEVYLEYFGDGYVE